MWQDNGLVVTNSKGTPLEAQNAVNRLQAALETGRFA